VARGKLIIVTCALGKNGVPGYKHGDPVANAETGGTGRAEKGILHTVQGRLSVWIEGTAKVGEDLVDHGWFLKE
jgi:hypothetical protein